MKEFEKADADIIHSFIRQGSKQAKQGMGYQLNNANSSKTFANFKAELQEAGIPTDLSNSFLSFLEKNIYSNEGVNFSQLNNALKVLNSYYKEAKDSNFKDHIKRAMETFIRDDIKQGIDAIFAQNKTLYKDAQNLFSSALNDYAVMKNTIKVIDKLKLRDEIFNFFKDCFCLWYN